MSQEISLTLIIDVDLLRIQNQRLCELFSQGTLTQDDKQLLSGLICMNDFILDKAEGIDP